jgi:hypothetical protein
MFVHSSCLREDFAQTSVLLSITSPVAGSRGADIAMVIVHKILQDGWERWYALGTLLPWLAEAAPSTFLTALEQQLDRDGAGMHELFANRGPMQGDRSAGFLWALELLA